MEECGSILRFETVEKSEYCIQGFLNKVTIEF